MAVNPYPYGDPRRVDFNEQERRQRELIESQQQVSERQERLLSDQADALEQQAWALQEPQRARDAIKEKARQERILKWMADAPKQVRDAARRLQDLQSQSQIVHSSKMKSAIDLITMTLSVIAFVVVVIAFNVGNIYGIVISCTVLVALITIALRFSKAIAREAEKGQAERIALETRLRATVEEYIGGKEANQSPQSTEECPFCKETIKSGAAKCKHCGELL